jgi:hypothetical protein
MKAIVKSAVYSAFPDTALRIFSARARRAIERFCEQRGLTEHAFRIAAIDESKVLGGPFKGMRIDYSALPVHTAPKYVGTYEKEIIPFVEDAIRDQPEKILDVGASDGYYVVGLALRVPGATVYAAEADWKSIKATMANAKLNGVKNRVMKVGIIHPGDFAKYLVPRASLVVMDCEGAEFRLLDPTNDPVLAHVNILVEVHEDHGQPNLIIERFASTHTAQVAREAPRTMADIPPEHSDSISLAALDEYRRSQSWIYLKLKTDPGPVSFAATWIPTSAPKAYQSALPRRMRRDRSRAILVRRRGVLLCLARHAAN